MLSPSKLKAVVEPILKDNLSRFGYIGVDIFETQDHDGEPVIKAVAKHVSGSPELDASFSTKAALEVMSKLSKLDETRFFHLTHSLADESLTTH